MLVVETIAKIRRAFFKQGKPTNYSSFLGPPRKPSVPTYCSIGVAASRLSSLDLHRLARSRTNVWIAALISSTAAILTANLPTAASISCRCKIFDAGLLRERSVFWAAGFLSPGLPSAHSRVRVASTLFWLAQPKAWPGGGHCAAGHPRAGAL